MEKFIKILKINILSIVALPLLLIATASKLIAKALEKIALIIGMLMITLFIVIAFSFFKNPSGGFEVILYMIVLFVIAFVFIMILFLLMTVAAATVTAIWALIVSLFEGIYGLTYRGFLNLYAICERDYQYISLDGNKKANMFLCLFFTILRAVNKLIVTVISFALPASIILSVLLVAESLFSLHRHVKTSFGIGLLQYVGKFDTFSIVYGIVMYIAIISVFVVVIISLGIEWHEWAVELKMTGEELDENIQQLQNNDWHVARSADADTETGDAYMVNLEEHVDSLESLGNMVEEALSKQDNPLLRSSWGNYFRSLSNIIDECTKYKDGIPLEKFKKLIPQIQHLEKQREEVKSLAEKQLDANNDPVKYSVFFAGCNTVEKLEKRYKSLCKTYHPDSEGGDTDTFQKMQEEYEVLKKHFSN